MVVTGESKSRLYELKKYTNKTNFFEQYKLSVTEEIDGINQDESNVSSFPNKIVYYIGGIEFIDYINEDQSKRTIFRYNNLGYSSPDFTLGKIIKDENKLGIVKKPKVDSDVFIDRQQISVFNDIYKLDYVNTMDELLSFGGGAYFNIISNT